MPEDCVKYLRRDLKYKVEWAKWKQLFAMNSWFPMSLSFLLIPHLLAPCHFHDFYEKRVHGSRSCPKATRAWGKKEAAEAEVEAAVAEAVKVAAEAGLGAVFFFQQMSWGLEDAVLANDWKCCRCWMLLAQDQWWNWMNWMEIGSVV